MFPSNNKYYNIIHVAQQFTKRENFNMGILKKSGLVSLGMVMLLSITQEAFASTEKNPPLTELTTEEGNKVGLGIPKIKFESVKTLVSNGSISRNFNFQHKQSIDNNSIKQSIFVNPSPTGTTIDVPFEFGNGEYVILSQDEEGKTNTGNVYNKDHKSIGIVSTQVADNQEEKVTLDTEMTDNDNLAINVKSDDLNKPAEIVVTLAATYYSTYFSDFSWITRDGVKSLSLAPTSYLRNAPGFELSVRMADAWNKLYAVHSGSSNWYNTGGMKDQFDCHATYARTKSRWNLEPSRPNVSYAETVSKACNP